MKLEKWMSDSVEFSTRLKWITCFNWCATMTGVEIVIPSGGKTRLAGPEVRERWKIVGSRICQPSLIRDTNVSSGLGDYTRIFNRLKTLTKEKMEHKQTILLAPALSNSSCWRRDTSEATWTGPGPGELLRATLILVLSLGILCANLLVICVINSRRYSKYIHAQVGIIYKK